MTAPKLKSDAKADALMAWSTGCIVMATLYALRADPDVDVTAAGVGSGLISALFGSVGVAVACAVVGIAWVIGCGFYAFCRELVGPLVRSQSPAVELRAGLWRACVLFWITVRGEVR